MSKFTLLFCATLLLSSQALAGDLHAAFMVDVKGDAAGFVKMSKEFDAVAAGILGDNTPDVVVIQSTFAGPQSGSVYWVVQFDDLTHLASSEAKLATSKEA